MLHAARTTTGEPEPVQSLSDWARARLRALSGCGLPERFEVWDLHGALAQLGSAGPERRAAGERPALASEAAGASSSQMRHEALLANSCTRAPRALWDAQRLRNTLFV